MSVACAAYQYHRQLSHSFFYVEATQLICSIFLISLQSENMMLSDKQKIEKEQNVQLRNQVAHLLQVEQEKKVQIKERDMIIQALQVGFFF